jgi:hypothetical protein
MLTGNSTITTQAHQTDVGAEVLAGTAYSWAENTAQGTTGIGICEDCNAHAENTVLASGNSTVNGQTSATAINQNSEDVSATALNSLDLHDASGRAQASAHNIGSEDSVALTINDAGANSGGSIQSTVDATNAIAEDSLALGINETHATNGGEASSKTQAITGSRDDGDGGNGAAIAVSNTSANNTSAATTTTADLSNDGTSNGLAYSVSYDANGNVAVAVVFTNSDGNGVAVSATNAINGEANADGTADGSSGMGSTSGISYRSPGPDAPTANTSTGATPP